MTKNGLRIISLFLLPSLVLDPLPISAFTNPATKSNRHLTSPARFDEQALALEYIQTQFSRYILKFGTPRRSAQIRQAGHAVGSWNQRHLSQGRRRDGEHFDLQDLIDDSLVATWRDVVRDPLRREYIIDSESRRARKSSVPTGTIRFSRPGLKYELGRLIQLLGFVKQGYELRRSAIEHGAPADEAHYWDPVIEAVQTALAQPKPADLIFISARQSIRPLIRQEALRYAKAHGSKALVNRKWVPIHKVQENGKTPFDQLVVFYDDVAVIMVEVYLQTLQEGFSLMTPWDPRILKIAKEGARMVNQELHRDHNQDHFDNPNGVPLAIMRTAA